MDYWVVPQMVWSLYMLIEDVRIGIIGPRMVALYVAIFVLLLLATRRRCKTLDEREAARAARRAR
jgi:hypothetical protein